jgi:hypothetical protein
MNDDDIKELLGPWGQWGDGPVTGYTRELFDRINEKLARKSSPLSEERLMELMKESHAEYWGSNAHFRKFARAIEQEHGVK